MAPSPRPATLRCPGCGRLEQEPDPPLGLVDPVLEQAGGGDVAMLVAEIVGLLEVGHQLLVVVAQLGQHVLRRDIGGLVVEDALQLGDLPDRAQRGGAKLAHALGDVVDGGEDLLPPARRA